MSPQTRTTLSPPPPDRNVTAVTSEVASSSQYPRMSPNDIYRGPAPEHRQWPRNRHKFWIYGSPSSGSSQDGSSSTSSGGNSTGSEGPEVKRAQTVSPYGSFFAEEMEFDTPTESRSSYPGDRQENATVFTDMSRAFHPTQDPPSARGWTSSQAQVAPIFFVPGYPTHTGSRPFGAVPTQDRNEPGPMRVPLLQSYLAENSRLSRPPDSWRAEFLDRTYSPHWQNTQRDSPQAATTLPPGRPHPGQNE
jgi:hypothetical protein